MSDDDSTTHQNPTDPNMVAAANTTQQALAAATVDLKISPVSKKFHFEVQTTLHLSDGASL